jgi:hypothetical protein
MNSQPEIDYRVGGWLQDTVTAFSSSRISCIRKNIGFLAFAAAGSGRAASLSTKSRAEPSTHVTPASGRADVSTKSQSASANDIYGRFQRDKLWGEPDVRSFIEKQRSEWDSGAPGITKSC